MITLANANANIWDEAGVIVVPVNCVGVAGKGLALEAKSRFPIEMEAYRKVCMPERKLFPGLTLNLTASAQENDRSPYRRNHPDLDVTLYAAATKDNWKNPSELRWIRLIVEHTLPMMLRSHGHTKCAVPALGCGLGGLPWRNVEELFARFEDNYDGLNIELFPPR
jgi:hypothetical protein